MQLIKRTYVVEPNQRGISLTVILPDKEFSELVHYLANDRLQSGTLVDTLAAGLRAHVHKLQALARKK